NLRSVVKAIAHLGYEAKVTSDPQEVLRAPVVILPGVGAAAEAMEHLRATGMVEPIRELLAEDRPFLGICLGLQVLFSTSEEGGEQPCLDLIPGTVRRLPPGLKIPHMGWNQVRQKGPHPIFEGIPDAAHFYFVHSYYAQPEDSSLGLGETDYGITFSSVIARGNLVATQFHPEKSGELGLRLYHNFLRRYLGG
ncbi:MAG: imidazole glycerol phosphate synthase subunit HisH, partial [Dehalococcoidia bacterium]